jgi:MFS transporter, FSR family, fosmidomycin resistance protein
MLSIAIRSTVGMGDSWQLPKSTTLLIGIPVAAFAGKALGGWLSDRLGWIAVSVVALLASAPLIAWGGAHLYVLLAGLLLFQMTMPVTLAATARAVPGKPATAFGLTTLALVAGALPTFFPWGKAWYGNTLFVILIGLSASAVYTALRLLGRPAATEPA